MSEKGKCCRIFLDAGEYAEIERIAGRRNMSVEEWITDKTRLALADYHERSERIKQATEKALKCQHPTADIEQMLAEIAAGYLSDDVC